MLAPISKSNPATIEVEVTAFQEYTKNTLEGFIDLELSTIGLAIFGATLYRKNESRWIGLPNTQYEEAGEKKWVPVVDFTDKDARAAFQQAALAVVYEFRAAEGRNW